MTEKIFIISKLYLSTCPITNFHFGTSLTLAEEASRQCGFKFPDEAGKNVYYRYTVLPFGGTY